MLKRSLPIVIVVLLFFAISPVQAYEVQVEEVINTPTATVKKTFSIDTTMELWSKALDNPCLMGRIWGAYGFQPFYTVTATATGVHVSDPSGINGNLRQIGRSDRARTFSATGSFDHWAVPSFFTASGVITVTHARDRDGLSGEIAVFLRGDNGISRFVMTLFSGILTRRIGNRSASTLENVEVIIRDIAYEPRKVRDCLTGEALSDFDRVFPTAGTAPGDGKPLLDLQDRMYR